MNTADALASFPGLDRLETSARRLLERSTQPIRIPLGSVPIKPGRPCDGLHFVLSGRIRVLLLSESGRDILLYRVEAGQTCILSCASLLSGSDYPAEAVAETDVAAVLLPRAAFEELMGESAGFRAHVFAVFGRRLADLMTVVDEVAFSRVQSRLARLLLDRRDADGRVRLSHREIAAELGSAREVISRQLKGFERRRWISLERRCVDVIDSAALTALMSDRNAP